MRTLHGIGGSPRHWRCSDAAFSGIALYHPTFFVTCAGSASDEPLFDQAIGEGRLSGEHFRGEWIDVGSPERLEQIRIRLAIN